MTRAERRFYRAVLISFVAFWLTACLLYSNLYAQIGPIVIPTPTMLPAPTTTPSDGDDFVIMWHVVYLPFVEVNHAR
jgi:hypothetical protein